MRLRFHDEMSPIMRPNPIAPEHQDKVFERFYRVDKSHSKQSGGTGLGLSIVKHAVQYHHGKIAIESELNKGTTISVLFDTRA